MFNFFKSLFVAPRFEANGKIKNLNTTYAVTHKNITQKWKDMDQINDRITFASSISCEYKAKMDLYFINKKLLELYQTLHRVLCEISMDKAFIDKIGSNETDMDDFANELKRTVQFERNLTNITPKLRTELMDVIKFVLGCIGVVLIAVLYIYAKVVSVSK